jgi:cytochrome c5
MKHFSRTFKLAVFALLGVALLLVTAKKISTPPPKGIEIDHQPSVAESVATVEHGREVAQKFCAACHNADFSTFPRDTTQEVDLATAKFRPRIKCYGEDEFFCLMQNGTKRDGDPVQSIMPAIVQQNLSDDDVHAVWYYSQSLPQQQSLIRVP